jgi:hypothetical protein
MPDDDGRETPYDIAERYARGEISRDELIAQLVDFDYKPQDRIPDDMSVDIAEYVDGSWDDVERAAHDHLIDYEIYGIVQDAIAERKKWPAPNADDAV